jgi:membrane-bound lytic murein transglycosylase B
MVQALLAAAVITKSLANPIADVKAKLKKNGFTTREINAFFSDKRLKLYTQKTIAGKPVDWEKYNTIILKPGSVDNGTQFLKTNQASFAAAETAYGVPKELIAAVIRVETNFGTNTGGYIVPDVFYSFIKHGKKVAWAKDNLVATLIYAKREHIDPFTLKGSYAGALGYPQFLPSSILSFAVDGNADGKVNLMTPEDAIPSLANFLKEHGYADSPKAALTHYYGSSVGYPDAAMMYAEAVKGK